MKKILPISSLENYEITLKKVSKHNPVYLAENGTIKYVLMDIEDEKDNHKYEAFLELLNELEKGRQRGKKEGYIAQEEVLKHIRNL